MKQRLFLSTIFAIGLTIIFTMGRKKKIYNEKKDL